MNGDGLKKFREGLKLSQTEFYSALGFFPSYGNLVENNFGKRSIPQKMFEQVEKKYNLKKDKK
jgi:hypothetical protein